MNQSQQIIEDLGEAKSPALMKFIKANQAEVDAKIKTTRAYQNRPPNSVLNDNTRWTYIFNDEDLMAWVKSKGVKT